MMENKNIFSDDIRERMSKMEQEVDRLKSLQTEVMRISFQIANLSDKMEARFNTVDVKLASVDKSIQALDNRLGRLEMLFYGLLVGIVTIFVGGLATVLGLPYLKIKLF